MCSARWVNKYGQRLNHSLWAALWNLRRQDERTVDRDFLEADDGGVADAGEDLNAAIHHDFLDFSV